MINVLACDIGWGARIFHGWLFYAVEVPLTDMLYHLQNSMYR